MSTSSTESSSFGTLLKAFRHRQHLTQVRLAERLGVHRHAIGRWEQGDVLPASKTVVLELARHLRLDDQESRQLLEASFTALVPHWSVPLPRNPYFTGREEILKTLFLHLSGDQRMIALSQSAALHGLGGIGKTQIALEYAYRHALEYSAVFWIGAETVESCLSSLVQIAQVLQLSGRDDQDQQRAVEAVQRWLVTHSQWLLIWDNVEELGLLDRFLPSVRQGAILLTTRCQTLGTLAQGIDLMPMEAEEGMLFLLRRAKVLEPAATSEEVRQLAVSLPGAFAAAHALVEALGGLPLALDQAGAYLEATHCSLSAYLDLFRTEQAALLRERGDGVREHPSSVWTTFTLALEATTRRHPAVGDLLKVCALLHAEAIPEELFRQGAAQLGAAQLGAALEAACRDPLEWNQVIAVACAYSLLQRHPEAQTLSLHRLVQAVVVETMTAAERAAWSGRAIGALDVLFPTVRLRGEPAAWKQGERLLPHALRCLEDAGEAEASLVLASLAFKVAQYLVERARPAEAEPLYQRALRIREQRLGPDHVEVANALSDLAYLFLERGQQAEAEPLYLRAVHISEQTLGADHVLVARMLNNLALLYRDQGRYPEAEARYQRAVRIVEQTPSADPLLPALLCSNLAHLYREQGRDTEAEALYQRAVQIVEHHLGADHPRLMSMLTGLANLCRDQGRDAEAEALYQRAWVLWEAVFGPDHPYGAHLLNGLANLRRAQGREAEAEALYQRALSLHEHAWGKTHPDVAETLHDLACFRQRQGRLREAYSLAARALSIRRETLGATHPKTRATQVLSAHLLQQQAQGVEQAAASPGAAHRADPGRARGQAEKTRRARSKAVAPALGDADPLQGFLAACCEMHPLAWCRVRDLWQAYEHWSATEQRYIPLSRRDFAAHLRAHGCHASRTNTARIWRGVRLVQMSQ
jgi:tetratricopeptide (TPR) repeat protein/transcriptional regulator with XRE-family HTH domain